MHYDTGDEHSKKKCMTLLHDELQILDKVLEIFDKLLTALGKRKCLVGKEIEILLELVLVRALFGCDKNRVSECSLLFLLFELLLLNACKTHFDRSERHKVV